MIAPPQKQRQSVEQQHYDRFLEMVPLIRSLASRAFRHLRSEGREEMIEEVIANAFCAFARLVRRGKGEAAFATPLAHFAIRQVLAGRRVGAKLSTCDVMSPRGSSVHGIRVEQLNWFECEQGEWRQVLVEDRHATPADIAAARIDVSAWFSSLSPRHCRIARILAMGETTSGAARRFGLSSARISQLRAELQSSWEEFQGEAI
jgi:hypothetical protein